MQDSARKGASGHLKQACEITGAAWAARVGILDRDPAVLVSCQMTPAESRRLETFLKTEHAWKWLRALGGKASKSSMAVGEDLDLGTRRIWGYADGTGCTMLVGADVQGSKAKEMWSLVCELMAGPAGKSYTPADSASPSGDTTPSMEEAKGMTASAGARRLESEGRLVQAAKLVAVGEMAAGVAHELNNPLTTVSGFAELVLQEIPADAPYRADLEMVRQEAHRARAVVRRLLDFARQGEHVRTRASMNEIVDDVLTLMTHFIHTSGVQLEVDLEDDLPWVTLDVNEMKQVMLNLLHNALHAMSGGGRLAVRTESRTVEGRGWIVAHVADTGIGMSAEELGRIFEPFYTTRSDSGGTGLGLSVTYGIVTDHGGRIEVRSERGSGSTFSVWLPV